MSENTHPNKASAVVVAAATGLLGLGLEKNSKKESMQQTTFCVADVEACSNKDPTLDHFFPLENGTVTIEQNKAVTPNAFTLTMGDVFSMAIDDSMEIQSITKDAVPSDWGRGVAYVGYNSKTHCKEAITFKRDNEQMSKLPGKITDIKKEFHTANTLKVQGQAIEQLCKELNLEKQSRVQMETRVETLEKRLRIEKQARKKELAHTNQDLENLCQYFKIDIQTRRDHHLAVADTLTRQSANLIELDDDDESDSF